MNFGELIMALRDVETKESFIGLIDDVISLYEQNLEMIDETHLSLLNYEDMYYLNELNSYMSAYFGVNFYRKCGIPFIQKYNKNTIYVIETTILFYTIQIAELIKTGFFDELMEAVMDYELDFVAHMEYIDIFTTEKNKSPLFFRLWDVFNSLIQNNNGGAAISGAPLASGEPHVIYLQLREGNINSLIQNCYHGLICYDFIKIPEKMLHDHKEFSPIEYMDNYQSLFVEVAYQYLISIESIAEL